MSATYELCYTLHAVLEPSRRFVRHGCITMCHEEKTERKSENHSLRKFYNSRYRVEFASRRRKRFISINTRRVRSDSISRLRRIISGESDKLRCTFGPSFSESLRSNPGVPDNPEPRESLFVGSSLFAEVVVDVAGIFPSEFSVCENERRVTHRLRSISI